MCVMCARQFSFFCYFGCGVRLGQYLKKYLKIFIYQKRKFRVRAGRQKHRLRPNRGSGSVRVWGGEAWIPHF